MGLGDLVSKVLVEVKGDVSDLKGKLKDLTGEEKKLAEAQLKATEARNKGLDAWVDRLGKVGLALDTVGKVADYAKESLREAGEYARLTAATSQISIDKLSVAFRGLVNEHDLLTFAAQTSHGALRLNQEEMETVGKAAVALQARGFDLTDAIKKLTDAAVKGKTGGLDDFGLTIKEGGSRAQTTRNLLAELNKVIAETGPITDTTADSIQRASVQWDNMGASIKRASAELFVAVDSLDQIRQKLADRQWREFMDNFGVGGIQQTLAFAKGIAQGRQNVLDSEVIEFDELDLSGDVRALREKRKADAEKRAKELAALASKGAKDSTDALVALLEGTPISAVDLNGGAFEGLINPDKLSAQLDFKKALEGNALDAKGYEAFRAGKQKTFLESTFGELDEFNAYREAFGALTGAVSAGLTAWIDGSESAGQAIKKFLAEALKGLAAHMAVESLKHAAYAIGSAAFGDLKGAASHGAAAAAFGVGAAAAAVAAKSLGGGGGAQPATQTGTPSYSGGTSTGGVAPQSSGGHGYGSGGGGGPIVNQFLGYVDEDSPRLRQRRAQRLVNLGTQHTSAGGSF